MVTMKREELATILDDAAATGNTDTLHRLRFSTRGRGKVAISNAIYWRECAIYQRSVGNVDNAIRFESESEKHLAKVRR